ncbi:hypothetical protein PZN02_001186 [Sinorhizobium garamanticum]|uniref:Uncharacterized protein n=1 Tax=Sinorhizobium garamanticum TaxID=680247 RepID=A0ABY8DF67_9HYPH|nr:hypothetical protein [Sinorhizobium garamanticum]WEX88677.1 hypothetical protein PZN02_001186 [Sinorhizobium garamanticum]
MLPRNIPLLLFEQLQEGLTVFRPELRQIKEMDHRFNEAVIQIIESMGLDRPDPGVSLSKVEILQELPHGPR